MSVIAVYTLDDYLESPAVIEIGTIDPNKDTAFPAVSLCIRKFENNKASTERVEQFVEKYYAEHNIEVNHPWVYLL